MKNASTPTRSSPPRYSSSVKLISYPRSSCFRRPRTGAAEPRLSHSRTCTSTSRLSRKSPHDQDSRPWYELAVVARAQNVNLVTQPCPFPGGDAHLACLGETQLGADLRSHVHALRVRGRIPYRDRDLLVLLDPFPLGHL